MYSHMYMYSRMQGVYRTLRAFAWRINKVVGVPEEMGQSPLAFSSVGSGQSHLGPSICCPETASLCTPSPGFSFWSTFSELPQSLLPNVTVLALSCLRPEFSQLRAYRQMIEKGWTTTSWWQQLLVESMAICTICGSVASLRTIGIGCNI